MSGVVNGTWVHQWEKTTGKGQRWEIVPADGGKAKVRNVLADKVIDLVGMRLITVPRPDLAGCVWRKPAVEHPARAG